MGVYVKNTSTKLFNLGKGIFGLFTSRKAFISREINLRVLCRKVTYLKVVIIFLRSQGDKFLPCY